MYNTEDILALVAAARSRELTTREDALFDLWPREVYKDINIKILNDISREGEESDLKLASPSIGEDRSPEGMKEKLAKEEEVLIIAPADTTSRTFSGISAQHHKTAKGIKVSITLQKADEVDVYAYIELTAELKRHNRIRELKPYSYDGDDFAELYSGMKNHIRHNLLPEIKEKTCIGRLHQRGSRSAWIADMFVIGELDQNDILKTIKFYHDDEYIINMDQALTRRQTEIYHSSGLYGELRRRSIGPTLANLKRKHF